MEKTTPDAAQLARASHLADLLASAQRQGLAAGWRDYIKAECQAIGVSWEQMERAVSRRVSSAEPPAHGG